MKNFRILFGFVILLLGTMGIFTAQTPSKEQAETPKPSITPLSLPTQPVDVLAARDASNIKTFLVTRVVDGDTIEIEGGKTVRYIGVNTPETVDPRRPMECFGSEASQKNKELVLGKHVRLEKDVSEMDKFGRLLRYVWVGETFINEYLIRQGYAYASAYPPDISRQDVLRQAQSEARQEGLGLWSVCGTEKKIETVHPATPSVSGCVVKGNINGSGEKIYHVPGCGSYEQTSIDSARGEKIFCSEEEAQSAGWRKAGNC